MDGKQWYNLMLCAPEWQAKRKEIYDRDCGACVDCGQARYTIDCHHTHYVSGKKPWEYPSYALVTVCRMCHDKRHKGKIPVFGNHDEAEMWFAFQEAEAALIEIELESRDNRIDRLEELGATWDSNGRFYALVDKNGRDRFYDEDGDPM